VVCIERRESGRRKDDNNITVYRNFEIVIIIIIMHAHPQFMQCTLPQSELYGFSFSIFLRRRCYSLYIATMFESESVK